MEDIGKQIDTLLERAVGYVKTTVELEKLKAIDRVSDISALLITRIMAGAILFFVALFLSLGLALWLGEVLGKIYLGFFVVAAIYGLIAVMLQLFLGKWIKKAICNFIISKILY